MDNAEFEFNIEEFQTYAIEGINRANNGNSPKEYATALWEMRKALEYFCRILFLHHGLNDKKSALFEVGDDTEDADKNLSQMIKQCYDKRLIGPKREDDNKAYDGLNRRTSMYNLKDLGNKGTHLSTTDDEVCLNDCLKGRVILCELIEFLYSKVLKREISTNLNNAMNSRALLPEQRNLKDSLSKYCLKKRNEFTDTVLDDVNLSDIYVEPNVRFHKNVLKQYEFDELNKEEEKYAFVKSKCNDNLHALVDWFVNDQNSLIKEELKSSEARLLLILGQAGQGKTSLCKKIMYDNIDDEGNNPRNIFLIRLRDVLDEDLFSKPLSVLFDRLKNNIDEDTFSKSVLILDGLDELSMTKDKSIKDADDLIERILKYIDADYNDIKVIITSRENCLNIDNLLEYNNKGIIVAQIEKLDKKQQVEWLQKYFSAIEGSQRKINLSIDDLDTIYELESKHFKHFRELFSYPVLLHLFILSDIKFDAKASRIKIYNALFQSLRKREWENKQIDILKNITDEQLKLAVQEIAYQMYLSGKTFLLKSEFKTLFEKQEGGLKEFIQQLTAKNVEIEDLYRALMIAFYWEDRRVNDNFAIEFYHKSLQEYLSAEKIWNEFKRIVHIELAEEALSIIWKFCAHQILSQEIQEYLLEVIEADHATDKKALFEKMRSFVPELLKRQFMLEIYGDEPIKAGLYTFRA